MLQLEALNGQLEDQLNLHRLRKEPCDCPTEEAGNGTSSSQCARRVEALETFVEELKDSNRILVETLSELESEARKRVRLMEQVLERTAHAAKTYMVELDEYERTTRNALKDKLKYLSVIEKLGAQISRLERGKSEVQDHCNNLTHDINSLVRLISHARNTGRWEIGNIDFCEVTCEQVFGSIDKLDSWPGDLERIDNAAFESVSAIRAENESFKAMSIPERPSSVFSQSSIRTIGESSSGGHVTRRDAELYRLQVELRYSQKQLTAMQSELSQRDRTIAELQVQIIDLNHEISLKDSECFAHHHHHHQHLQQRLNGAGRASATSASFPNATTTFASELIHFNHSGAFGTSQTDEKERNIDPQLGSASQATSTSDSGLDVRNDPHRLHEMVTQLRERNDVLSRDSRRESERLSEREKELHEATERCARLERELGDVERVWQELDACKEDGEIVRTELELERRKVRELLAAMQQQREKGKVVAAVVACSSQTEAAEENAELDRLSQLEHRHRLKASGLEMVVGQLQDQLRALADDEIKRQKLNGVDPVTEGNSAERACELEESLSSLRQELSVILEVVDHKNFEIENQKLTIRNLQEAVVSMKRTSPAAAPVVTTATSSKANGNCDAPASMATNGAAAVASKLSKSRDILHI